jgi:ribosomal protein L24
VTIIAGQQKGIKGVVKERVDQNTLRVGFGTDHSSTVDVPNQFVKVSDYEMGDTVKVIHGDGKGVEGLVVEVTEEGVILHDGKATV